MPTVRCLLVITSLLCVLSFSFDMHMNADTETSGKRFPKSSAVWTKLASASLAAVLVSPSQ